MQPETPEYRAACKLWDLYIRTKNEFVQRGDYDEDDDDDDPQENSGGATEEEVRPHTHLLSQTRHVRCVGYTSGLRKIMSPHCTQFLKQKNADTNVACFVFTVCVKP